MAAGMLIIEDAPGSLPDEIMALTEIILFFTYYDTPSFRAMSLEYEAVCMEGGVSAADCDDDIWSEAPEDGPTMFLINGQFQPLISLAANRWYRWRMASSSASSVAALTLEGCEMMLLGKDGVYLPTAPRKITKVYIGPGNRGDMAVRCPAGVFEFQADPMGGSVPMVSQVAARVEVSDEGDERCTLPTFEVTPPVSHEPCFPAPTCWPLLLLSGAATQAY